MIKHLIQNQGLDSDSKKIVIFGGVSIGAVGAMTNIDHVAATLKRYNAQVLGYLDSPLYFDMEPLYPSKIVGVKERMKT